MDDAMRSKSYEDEEAAERLIVKLIVDPNLVGTAKDQEKSRLISLFWKELEQFQNRMNRFDRDHIWDAATLVEMPAHVWHKTYSVSITEVLVKHLTSVQKCIFL